MTILEKTATAFASVLVLTAVQAAFAAQTVTIYPDGSTVPLAAGDASNATGNTFGFGSNCTLKLSGDTGGGLFELKPAIMATNGCLVVDATEVSNCTGIRWLNHVAANDGISVKGLDYILLGPTAKVAATTIGSTNVAYCGHLQADFAFLDGSGAAIASPAGLVLTNMVALMTTPTCPCRIADGTWLWPGGSVWPAQHVETFDLTNHNYGVLSENSLNADTLRVHEGCEVALRICGVQMRSDSYGVWTWGGSDGEWNRNVQLAGGALRLVATRDFTLNGAVTGEGDIYNVGGTDALLTLNGEHSVTGNVFVGGKGIVFSGSGAKGGIYPGSPENILTFTTSDASTVRFRPAGYGSSATAAYANSMIGLSTNNVLAVERLQTLTVGAISGALSLEGPVGAAVVISNLAANTLIKVPDGMDVTALSAGYGVQFALANDNGTGVWNINGPAVGEAVRLSLTGGAANMSLTLGGKLSLPDIPGAVASVTLQEGADIRGAIPHTCQVHSLGGKLTLSGAPAWQDKIWLWGDASETNTFVYLREMSAKAAGTAGSDVRIWKWLDRRPSQTRYQFRNKRYNASSSGNIVVNVFPLKEPLDGITCVSMGAGVGHLNIFDGETSAAAASVATEYAIVVYGSQNGGGSAVVGNQEGAFARSGYAKSKAAADDYNIFTNAYETFVNGAPVNPTTTTLNGGWQLISFDTEGKGVQGIGFSGNGIDNQPDGRGYSAYAEIMLFSEKPTAEERQLIEEYLSAKWGIAVAHTNTLSQQAVTLSGRGEVSLDASAKLAGTFVGRIDLNGHDLVIPSGAFPISEAALPQTGLVAWFDPSLTASLVMSTDSAKPLEIDAILPRNATGVATSGLMLQSPIASDGTSDRRVHVSEETRGGVASAWMDFSDLYGDGVVNLLMVRKMPYSAALEQYNSTGSSGWQNLLFTTAFVVLDTVRGGGSPMCTYAGGGGGEILKRGASPSVTDPIWASGCADKVLSGDTRLDGVQVNGATAGFSGRPEVMSFSTSDGTVPIKSLSTVNGGANQEYIGEILFYNTTLEEDVRTGIEAYLMSKWFGRLPSGYTDFRSLEVTGNGTVTVPGIAYMPTFAAGFTGDVLLAADSLDFHFASEASVADEAAKFPGSHVALPAEVTVNLTFATRPAPNVRYTLIPGGIDAASTTFSVGTVSGAKADSIHLFCDPDDGSLYATVQPRGIVISVK